MNSEAFFSIPRIPNNNFLFIIVGFHELLGQKGWELFQQYISLRQNFNGAHQKRKYSPDFLTSVAQYYFEEKESKAVQEKFELSEDALERLRPNILGTILLILQIEGLLNVFIEQMQEFCSFDVLPVFDQKKVVESLVSNEMIQITRGIRKLPLLMENGSASSLIKANPHVELFLSQLGLGVDVSVLLKDVKKGPYYDAENRNWFRYFFRGEKTPDDYDRFPHIIEDFVLSGFLKRRPWDFLESSDWEDDIPILGSNDPHKHFSYFAQKLFAIRGNKRKLYSTNVYTDNEEERMRIKRHLSSLRFFYRFAFLLSFDNPSSEGEPLHFDFLPETFPFSEFLHDCSNPKYDEMVSEFYINHYKNFACVPYGVCDLFFKNWNNYPYNGSIERCRRRNKGLLGDEDVLRSAVARAKQLVVNMSITPTHTNWDAMLRNRRLETIQIGEQLRNEFKIIATERSSE